MDSDKIEQIAQGKRPEPTEYDEMRHQCMRLRRNGLYGIPKFFFHFSQDTMQACEKCVFGSGEHTCQ